MGVADYVYNPASNSILESSKWINWMDLESYYTQTMIHTRETSNRVKNMERAYIQGPMVSNCVENGKMI